MRTLLQNTTYIVVVSKAKSGSNWYSKVTNALKIKNGERTYFDLSNERIEGYTTKEQIAREFLYKNGFKVPYYLSEKPNLVIFENEVSYKQLKQM